MNFKEIQELIKLIDETELAEFKLKDGEFQIHIRSRAFLERENASAQPVSAPILSVPQVQGGFPNNPGPAPVPTPAASAEGAAPSESGTATPAAEASYLEIKSPMVGTFYRSPSPDKPVYVKVGDSVSEGETVCIVEAMKLFNEIESEVSGKIMKVMVEDAQPVEYDQVLFLVDPKG